jgi:hypothetical protein
MPGRKGEKRKREEDAADLTKKRQREGDGVDLILTAAYTKAVVSNDPLPAPSRAEAGAAENIAAHVAKKEQMANEVQQRSEQSKKAGEQRRKEASERLEQSRQASQHHAQSRPAETRRSYELPQEQILWDNYMTPWYQFWTCRCGWLNNIHHGDHCYNCHQRST